jgi:hypothetical protein
MERHGRDPSQQGMDPGVPQAIQPREDKEERKDEEELVGKVGDPPGEL